MSKNKKPFLSLCFDGDGLIKITGLKFKTIKGLTALDTTFYLRTFFYRMVNIDTFIISDFATVSCRDKDNTEYKALLYRLFATDTPLYDLSIYYKYFTKITLDNKKGLDLQKLLTKYRSVYAFPKDFMDFKDKPDCSEKAKLLNQLVRTLWSTDPDFNTFHKALLNFSVKTKDSIYYPCCKDCNGLFCANKKYALPKYLAESKQFLFKRGSARARRVKSKSKSKSKSNSKKSKKLIKKLHYL